MSEALLFLHILGAAAWLGANLVRALAGRAFAKGEDAAAASWHRTTIAVGRSIHTPAAAAVFITGFGLIGVSEGVFEMTDPFVVVGIIVVVVGAVLGMVVLGPNGERIASAYEQGDRQLAETVARRSSVVGWVDTALLAFATLVMVLHWGA